VRRNRRIHNTTSCVLVIFYHHIIFKIIRNRYLVYECTLNAQYCYKGLSMHAKDTLYSVQVVSLKDIMHIPTSRIVRVLQMCNSKCSKQLNIRWMGDGKGASRVSKKYLNALVMYILTVTVN